MSLTCSLEMLSQYMDDSYTGPGSVLSVHMQFPVPKLPYMKEFENLKSKLHCSEHQGESMFCWVDTSQRGAPHYPMCTQDLQEWARCCQQQGNVWQSICQTARPTLEVESKCFYPNTTLWLQSTYSLRFPPPCARLCTLSHCVIVFGSRVGYSPPVDLEFANPDDLCKHIITALKEDLQDGVDICIISLFEDHHMPPIFNDPLLSNDLATFMTVRWLGVPDTLLELQGPAGVVLLWCIDIASSEEGEELMSKFHHFMERCKDLLMVTIIDVHKSAPYKQPKDLLDMELSMEGILHWWVNPLKITIKTWLHHPEGQFSFNVKQSDNQYYACSQICPYPTMDTGHLDSVLKWDMMLI
ncbi:uncharacterized protein BJ212DRAFT_1303718 [Suillus subaureus]|uniref:Uncharacterized protein n=1 Tax=Suillus subaureus TaxID=48587 RepID=A0A9P7DYH7_9AGAM|nr:uncharacterized protein BJ212DRAFT_1303718 [Suillus subaureus]KAG1806204.1 hypothetical protein BJ212DRAFT_1303718 [Suillus subaureus]